MADEREELQAVADRIVKMLIEAVDEGEIPYYVAVERLDSAQDELIEGINDYTDDYDDELEVE